MVPAESRTTLLISVESVAYELVYVALISPRIYSYRSVNKVMVGATGGYKFASLYVIRNNVANGVLGLGLGGSNPTK